MRGMGYVDAYGDSQYLNAQSPFSYTGAQYAGAQVAATAGNLVQSVAAPVVGFTQGVFQGRALLVLGIVAAIVILKKSSDG